MGESFTTARVDFFHGLRSGKVTTLRQEATSWTRASPHTGYPQQEFVPTLSFIHDFCHTVITTTLSIDISVRFTDEKTES